MDKKFIYISVAILVPIWLVSFYFLFGQKTAPVSQPVQIEKQETGAEANKPASGSQTAASSTQPIEFKDGAVMYTMTDVSKDGYDFNAGKIDYSNNTLPDSFSTDKVANVLGLINFPKSLAAKTIVVFADASLLPEKIFLKTKDSVLTVSISKKELDNQGALYVSRADGGYSSIFISSARSFTASSFEEILIHELGHKLSDEFTKDEWAKYYALRYIQTEVPRYGKEWDLSPNEDFAEVYRYITESAVPDLDKTKTYIKTRYGFWKPVGKEVICKSILDDLIKARYPNYDVNSRLQDCRRYVMVHPDIYPSDKPIYYDANLPSLKEFIAKVLGRIGQAVSR